MSSLRLCACILVGASIFFSSCQTFNEDTQARCYHNGKPKPVLAIVPVFDNTQESVEWDLSVELTEGIIERVKKTDKLYLTQQNKVRNFIKDLRQEHNPFTLELTWLKPTFQGQDFVVFMELIEHSQKPLQKTPGEDPRLCGAELNISLRVRVLDLRQDQPKIVLQEIVHHTQAIPRQFTQYNYLQEAWGEADYSISTLGLAHAQLTKEVARRIEDYILLATSQNTHNSLGNERPSHFL